ncbi:hypothetical protein RB653_007072 [Dictyostelium firmibasis]|uniref:Uncharacterized protein n=1 Tax=Dictyostelium firmibasis TaxID=79012 RepID=A0AAN7TU00_9MYCE
MKKLIIIALCVLIQIVNGIKFLNLIPYKSNDCSGDVSGIGFSSVIDTCITYDYDNNYIFKVFKNMVSIESFKSPNGEQVCNIEDSNGTPINTEINACLPYSVIGNLNTNYQITDPYSSSSVSGSSYTGYSTGTGSGSGSSNSGSSYSGSSTYYSSSSEIESEYFYKITLTDGVPSIPSNSYVTSLMPNQCVTDSSNALIHYYFINGTWLYEYNSLLKLIFYCSKGIPYSLFHKEIAPEDMTISCNRYAPFFNSSYEVYPSSEATGCSSSGGSDGCADSGGSTGYSSSSSSGSINGETSGSGTSGSGNSGRSMTSSGSIVTTGSRNGNSNNHITTITSGSANFDLHSGDGSEEVSYQNVYCN